jgi:hypothetical protein
MATIEVAIAIMTTRSTGTPQADIIKVIKGPIRTPPHFQQPGHIVCGQTQARLTPRLIEAKS